MKDVEQDATQSWSGSVAWVAEIPAAPDKGSFPCAAKHQACAQFQGRLAEAIDPVVAVILRQVVVGPYNRSGPGALCSFDYEGD